MKVLSDKSIKIKEKRSPTESQPQSYLKPFRTGLRVRVAVGVALPILLLLISLSLLRYQYERQLLEEQVQLTALQFGEVMMSSLRYAMLIDEHGILAQTLTEMGDLEAVQQIQVVGFDGRVKADSQGQAVGLKRRHTDLGCVECHQFPAETRPQTTRLSTSAEVLRVAMPLTNDADCTTCHDHEESHLGILLVDMPIINIEETLRQNLQLDLIISIGGTLLVTVGLYLLIHRLVVRRVEAFRPTLATLAAGDFTARLPSSATPTDELDELVVAFNHMAEKLEHRAQEKEKRSKLRQQAMAEERRRIARELHDGLAQLLGYVNTKAVAVRLMLKKGKVEVADQTLLQLEEAARGLFVEVREAIRDLKTTGQKEADLITLLKECTSQFSRLSDLPVELTFAPAVERLSLSPDTNLQLLRIVQEALTNVRKHALASRVYVSLQTNNKTLELTISDNGQGFNPGTLLISSPSHFGLSTMRERAEAIYARFKLDSKPGTGTQIVVRLPLR